MNQQDQTSSNANVRDGSDIDEVGQLFAALIVEDDAVASRLLELTLDRRLGAIVRTAGSAEEAVPYVSSSVDWDAIFIDIGLPNADGLQFLGYSKKRCPDAVHIVITSRCDETALEAANNAGADAYLVKPVSTDALVRALSTVLQRRRGQASADTWAAA